MLDVWNRSHTNPSRKNSRKPFKWIIFDSLIFAGITFFAAWTDPVPTFEQLCIMLKSFGGAFLLQLAIERGIKR